MTTTSLREILPRLLALTGLLVFAIAPVAAQTGTPPPQPPGPVFWDVDDSSSVTAGDLVVAGPGAGGYAASNHGADLFQLSGQPIGLGTFDTNGNGAFDGNDSLYLDTDMDARHTPGDVQLRPVSYGVEVTQATASGILYGNLTGVPRFLVYADVNGNGRHDAGDYAYWSKSSSQLLVGDVRATPAAGLPVGSSVKAGDSDLVDYGPSVQSVPGHLGILASAVPDLLIQSLATDTSEDGQFLVVTVAVMNAGGVAAESAGLSITTNSTTVGPIGISQLEPGKTQTHLQNFVLSAFQRTRTILITATVQPYQGTLDPDPGNNFAETRVVGPSVAPTTAFPTPSFSNPSGEPESESGSTKAQEIPRSGSSGAAGPLVAGAGGAVLGFAGTTVGKLWKRRAWQRKAEDKTTGGCNGRKWRCVRETEKELKARQVTSLSMIPVDPKTRKAGSEVELSEKTVESLNQAIRGTRLDVDPVEIREHLDRVARALGASARTIMEDSVNPLDLRVEAELEGSEVATTFTLQRCVGGAGWRDIESWTVTLQDAGTETIAELKDVPNGPQGFRKVRSEAWIGPLLSFLERARPIVRVQLKLGVQRESELRLA